MHDLFAAEEELLEKQMRYLETIPAGGMCQRAMLVEMVKAYARILRQLRTLTRLSDKTTENLNSDRQELMEKVSYDALTGIFSRRYMDEQLEQMAESVSDPKILGGPFCFMMVDVDFFKRYNDIYGHPTGDVCLRVVATALADCVARSGGFAARYGGEEFAVVLPCTDAARARMLANELLLAVAGKRIPHAQNDAAAHVTISIGAVTGWLRAGVRPIEYMQVADKALYQSKQNGRNQVTYLQFEEVLA